MTILVVLSGMLTAIGATIIAIGYSPLLVSKRSIPPQTYVEIDHNVDHTNKKISQLQRFARQAKHRLILSAMMAVVVVILTRWVVAAIFAGCLPFVVAGLFAGNESKKKIENIEAIATWTEMLADTLAGSAGLAQAIAVSAPLAPPSIAAQVGELATYLDVGIPQSDALRRFGMALQEPLGDLVVATLLMASEHRAVRLGDVLNELAVTAREEANMYLRVEAQRASSRSAMRMVTGFSLGFAGLAMLVAHSYLLPYGTFAGQIVLVVVGSLFMAGLWLMSRMSHPAKVDRISLYRATST